MFSSSSDLTAKMNVKRQKLDSPATSCEENNYFTLVAAGNLSELMTIDVHNYLCKDHQDGFTLLHKAVTSRQDKDMVTYLISKEPRLMTEKDKRGHTALMLACLNPSTWSTAQIMLDVCTADIINVVDDNNATVMHHLLKTTIKNEHSISKLSHTAHNMLEIMLAKGGNINIEDQSQTNVLALAVSLDMSSLVQILLNNNAKITPNVILNLKHSETATMVLEKLENINEISQGVSLLHYVFINWQRCDEMFRKDLVKIMIEREAKIESNGPHVAELAKNVEFELEYVLQLIKTFPGYDIESKNKKGQTMLLQYVKTIEDLYTLLELGANVTAIDRFGNNLLHCILQQSTVS